MATRHNVRAMREAMGLTLENFADRIGVHATTIRRWESGEVSPSPMALSHMRRVWAIHKRDADANASAGAGASPPSTASAAPTSPLSASPSFDRRLPVRHTLNASRLG